MYRRSLSAGLGAGVRIHLRDVVECACVRAPPLDEFAAASWACGSSFSRQEIDENTNDEESEEPTFLQLLLATLGSEDAAREKQAARHGVLERETQQPRQGNSEEEKADHLATAAQAEKADAANVDKRRAAALALAAAHAPPWTIPMSREQRRQHSGGGGAGEDEAASGKAASTEGEFKRETETHPKRTKPAAATAPALSISFPAAPLSAELTTTQPTADDVTNSAQPPCAASPSSHKAKTKETLNEKVQKRTPNESVEGSPETPSQWPSCPSNGRGSAGAREKEEGVVHEGASSNSFSPVHRRASLSDWWKVWRPAASSSVSKTREEGTSSSLPEDSPVGETDSHGESLSGSPPSNASTASNAFFKLLR